MKRFFFGLLAFVALAGLTINGNNSPIGFGVGALHVDRNGTNQTVTAGVSTKIQFTTERWDTNGWFDNATNYRYTPLVAGKYLVLLTVVTNGAIGDGAEADIYKNGSTYAAGYYVSSTNTANSTSQASAIVSMNGSTDYIEAFAYSPTVTIVGAATATFMDIVLIGNGQS